MNVSAAGQRHYECGVPTEPQQYVGVVQFGREPLPVQGIAHRIDPDGVQGGEGIPPPHPERALEQDLRTLVLAARPSLGDQLAEAEHVHRHRVDRERVAATLPGDGDAVDIRQDPPHARHVRVQRVVRPLRDTIPPDPVDHPLDRHRLIGVDEQRHQHAQLPGMAQGDRPTVDEHPDIAEHPQLHRHGHHPRYRNQPL